MEEGRKLMPHLPIGATTLLFLLLLSLLPTFSYCQNDVLDFSCIPDNSKQNLNNVIRTVLGALRANASPNGGGYWTASSPPVNPRIYGLVQCRGDVSADDCNSCLDAALQQLLPTQCSDARIWFDYCFVRYQTQNFVGKLEATVTRGSASARNVSADPNLFRDKLGKLMHRIRAQAVGNASLYLGKGFSKLSPYETIYGLAQCTRDLKPVDCGHCVSVAVVDFHDYCLDKAGCKVMYSSCYVRYENYPFAFPLQGALNAGVMVSREGEREMTHDDHVAFTRPRP